MLYALGAERLRALPRSFHAWMAALGAAAFCVGLYYTGQNLHAGVTVGSASVAFCHLYFALGGRKGVRAGTGGEVAAGPRRGGLRAIFHRGSIFLSSFSYSLYLVHFSVITYLWAYLHGVLPAWQLILLSVVVCNVLAYAFYFMVERHFHTVGKLLKRHLLPRRGQTQS